MASACGERRTDSASRVIQASPQTIYKALLDPKAVATWRPPKDMTAEMYEFDARLGGRFRMALTYTATDESVRGKTSKNLDVVDGQFVELVRDQRVVERVEFESDDPAFAGAMLITTTLTPVSGGTEVTIRCDNVPPGISRRDHEAAMASTLQNLAAFTE